MAKIKAGYLGVEVKEEEAIWYDRKRVTVFALPWSFTKYTLTESRILVEKGLLVSREEEVKLYRVTDVSCAQNLIGKINNTGTITIVSNDATAPTLILHDVKNPKTIKNVISQAIETARSDRGVGLSEVIGDADPR
jgi:hypothetical protein